jgi:5-methylcytosine-specific restriction endonuclease McrA
MAVHHVVPREQGGVDEYKNLRYVSEPIHKLIHATRPETIEFYKSMLKLDRTSLKKLNKLRSLVGNDRLLVN